MREKQKNHQMSFHESDIEWLANEYKRRQSSDQSLTLEDFALQYGVMAERLRHGHSITLWHGTTMSRAESIVKEGFRPKKGDKGRIFFTTDYKFARRHANGRAMQEQDRPVIIMCSIDLDNYSDYQWQGSEVIAFKCERIDSEVVRRVNGTRS
jgi:hypothetical protein